MDTKSLEDFVKLETVRTLIKKGLFVKSVLLDLNLLSLIIFVHHQIAFLSIKNLYVKSVNKASDLLVKYVYLKNANFMIKI